MASTMSKKVRLTESDLHNIIRESVKKILREGSCWYGDEKPVENIIRMAEQIMSNNEHVNDDNYESMDDDGGDIHWDLYQWAKKVRDEAERWLAMNSSNVSIGDGTW